METEHRQDDRLQHGDVTRLLRSIHDGSANARDELANLVYGELRAMARALMSAERNPNVMQATDLVHKAYLKLFPQDAAVRVCNRSYFFAAAANAMKRILVDMARTRNSREARLQQSSIDVETLEAFEANSGNLLALNEALDSLKELNEQQFNIVQLRFFGGFSVAETAELLDIPIWKAESEFRLARLFLRRRITSED